MLCSIIWIEIYFLLVIFMSFLLDYLKETEQNQNQIDKKAIDPQIKS